MKKFIAILLVTFTYISCHPQAEAYGRYLSRRDEKAVTKIVARAGCLEDEIFYFTVATGEYGCVPADDLAPEFFE